MTGLPADRRRRCGNCDGERIWVMHRILNVNGDIPEDKLSIPANYEPSDLTMVSRE